MKVARVLVWSVVAVVAAAAITIVLLPRLLGSDAARHELERVLGDALGRPVTIGTLEFSKDAPRVELGDVVVDEVGAFVGAGAGGPFAKVSRLEVEIGLDALLRRDVVGTVVGEGVELHVVKKDGVLNVAGLGRRGAEGATKVEPVDLRLELELQGARVLLEDLDRGETLELRGVGVRAGLTNRADDREATLTVTIAQLDLHGVVVRDVSLQGAVDDEGWVVRRLHARIGGEIGEEGELEGHGRMSAGDDGPTWSAEATIAGVALDGPAADTLAVLLPVFAAARGEGEAEVRGRVGGTVSLQGTGLHWDRVAPTLSGEGELSVDDVQVPKTALALRVASLAGRPEGPWQLPHASARFTLADGWITLAELRTEEGGFAPKVSGRVSLTGELDLTVDLMPLVQTFGGGLYASVARVSTSIPVRVEGTVHDPKLLPPLPRDVAKGLAGGLLRRALTDPPAAGDPG